MKWCISWLTSCELSYPPLSPIMDRLVLLDNRQQHTFARHQRINPSLFRGGNAQTAAEVVGRVVVAAVAAVAAAMILNTDVLTSIASSASEMIAILAAS